MQYLQAASRRSLAEATERLNSHLDGVDEVAAATLAGELFAVSDLLSAEPPLRKHLADPAVDAADRTRLLRSLVGSQLGEPTLGVLDDVVGARWSQPRDLVDAVDTLGQLAELTVAQKQDAIEDVEDELFRVGRLLDREPKLRALVGDLTVPAQRRVELLRSVVGGKVRPVTERLLVRAVEAPRGFPLDRAAEALAELAAARRERSVARVRTPVALTDEQRGRLETALARIYARPISLQVELDEDLIGGLVVQVDDEVIDGSIAGRLVAAAQHLPH